MNIDKIKSWLIVGPGRTGSKLIVDTLRGVYRSKKIDPIYHSPEHAIIDPAQSYCVYHSHRVEDYLKLLNTDTQLVLSTRDMIDSALSYCIQEQTNIWHTYANLPQTKLEIKPFHLDLARFDHYYNRVNNFYVEILPHLNNKTFIIPYSEITNGYRKILELLNLNWVYLPNYVMPIKKPGNFPDWIINWDKIVNHIETLNRNPPI